MTWQRIDENTYIDDTLVTCAEYQLFIDEMREQGKYYQPDHWTAYQFPAGNARKPILGVRHSDAVEFCKWLIQRENRKMKYRLPTSLEAERFPLIMPFYKELMGFWLDREFEFAWINPDRPKEVEIDKNNPTERSEYSAYARVIVIDGAAIFLSHPGAQLAENINSFRAAFNSIRNLELDRNAQFGLVGHLMSNLNKERNIMSKLPPPKAVAFGEHFSHVNFKTKDL